MPPKKATYDDIDELRGEVKIAVGDLRRLLFDEIGKAMKTLETSLIKDINEEVEKAIKKAQQDTINALAEAKAYTDQARMDLMNHVAPMFPQIEELQRLAQRSMEKDKEIEESIPVAIDGLRKEIEPQLAALDAKIDREDARLRKELTELIAANKAEAAANLEVHRVDTENKFTATREEIEKVRKYVTKTKKEAADRDVETRSIAKQQVDELREGLDQRFEFAAAARKDLRDFIEEVKGMVHEEQERAIEVEKSLDKGSDDKVAGLREEARISIQMMIDQLALFKKALVEVDSLATRRVDWVIKGAQDLMRKPGVWFSPHFDACGCHNLQLEFRLLAPEDEPKEGLKKGDCQLLLWGPQSVTLVVRLFIGNRSEVVQMSFKDGSVPYGTGRACFIDKVMDRRTNSLRVGVEILEFVRIIERPIELTPENPDDVVPQEETKETLLNPKMEASVPGDIVIQRHMSHRILEQVVRQVERMRARMVRHVEWRIEQASTLRRTFPEGHALVSKEFDAAGIEGMQLVFYPTGYTGAVLSNCSYYLKAPGGSTLKVWLQAGPERRQASRTADQPAGAFGSTNFCRLEETFDTDEDCVTLKLDIEEAQFDMEETLVHAPGVTSLSPEKEDANVLPPVLENWGAPRTGKLTLKTHPGRIPPGLEEVKLLPSLWTGKNLMEDCVVLPCGLSTSSPLVMNKNHPRTDHGVKRNLKKNRMAALQLESMQKAASESRLPQIGELNFSAGAELPEGSGAYPGSKAMSFGDFAGGSGKGKRWGASLD
eukprot:TRINITY_DN111231_c0_g1_i1.p1 TRINITY_DN111231_c0_g1~~TRINITY_DN111231_c0_g1_i1.p1  ORF type:complete len:772 (-),score=210.02 TRINITY_DN111231_c0_g1_i1:107-2422(-)